LNNSNTNTYFILYILIMRNLLTNTVSLLNNASLANKSWVLLRANRFVFIVIKALYKEGIVQSFYPIADKNKQCLYIKIFLRTSVVNALKAGRTTKKNKHIFSLKDICSFNEKNKTIFFSTPRGVLTSLHCKRLGVGGAFLLKC
jgi:ribosomal protein S8